MVLTVTELISQEYLPFMTREYLTSSEGKRRCGTAARTGQKCSRRGECECVGQLGSPLRSPAAIPQSRDYVAVLAWVGISGLHKGTWSGIPHPV